MLHGHAARDAFAGDLTRHGFDGTFSPLHAQLTRQKVARLAVSLARFLEILHRRFQAMAIRTIGFQQTLKSFQFAGVLPECRPVSTMN